MTNGRWKLEGMQVQFNVLRSALGTRVVIYDRTGVPVVWALLSDETEAMLMAMLPVIIADSQH
jgi:hypothetical protein